MDPEIPRDLTPHVKYLDNDRKSWRERALKAMRSAREAVAKSSHVKRGIALAEVAGGAAVMGVVNGKATAAGHHDGAKFGPVPASLAIGGALVAAGVLTHKRWSDHAINLGTGVLAEFAGNWGFGVGQRWQQEGHFSLFGHGAGPALPPGTSAGELTPHQMADIVRQVQAAG